MKVGIKVSLEIYGDDLPADVLHAVEIASATFAEQLEAKWVDEIGPTVRKQYPQLKITFGDAESYP